MGSVMSQTMAERPSPSRLGTTDYRPRESFETAKTRQPSHANWLAVAKSISDEAPATRTTGVELSAFTSAAR